MSRVTGIHSIGRRSRCMGGRIDVSVAESQLEANYREWVSGEVPGELLDSSARLIRAVVGRKLRGPEIAQDIDDVSSEAMLELLARLDAVRNGEAQPIENYPAYVAGIGHHAVNNYFRRRYPQRHRLKNRLRYVLKAENGCVLWDAGDAGRLASAEELRNEPFNAIPENLPGGLAQRPLLEIAVVMLKSARGPVDFDALVDRVAELCGIRDQQIPLEEPPAP